MSKNTQELISGGNALAKMLPNAEFAALVKELAAGFECATLAARESCKERDELKQKCDALAAENAELDADRKTLAKYWISDGGDEDCAKSYCEPVTATDAALAEIRAQVWIEAKDFTKSMLKSDSVDHLDFLFDGKVEQLRKESGHA